MTPEKSKPCVLLLDDNEGALRLYRRMIERAGFEVVEARNSAQVLDIIAKRRPEAAVVDIRIPNDLDGYEICRRIRRESQGTTEVFLMTGEQCEFSDHIKGFEAGALAYYNKFESKILVEDLRYFLTESFPQKDNRVLVIDDEEQQLVAMATHLENSGFSAFLANSGRRGLSLACKLAPKAIVLDLGLPDFDGRKVLKFIKSQPRTKHIPVLIWTGSHKEGQENSCLDGGAVQFLIKGVNQVSAVPTRLKIMLGLLPEAQSERMERGPVAIDLTTRNVIVQGKHTDQLTALEFAVLSHLMKRSPQVVAWSDFKDPLARSGHPVVTDSAMHVHISHIKKKLKNAAACLVTHRGIGLQFNPTPKA